MREAFARGRERRLARAKSPAVAAAAVLVLFLVSTIAAPAAGARAFLVTAPYVGASSLPAGSHSYNSCSGSSVGRTIWNSSRGVFTFQGKANSSSCGVLFPGGSAGGSSEFSGSVLLYVPIHNLSAGKHSLTVNWSVRAAVRATLSNGTCTGNSSASSWFCSTEADYEVYLNSALVDLTTGQSFIYGGTLVISWVSGLYISHSGSTTVTSPLSSSTGAFGTQRSTFSQTVVAGDSYAVATYLEVIASAQTNCGHATLTGAAASLSVNMAGAGFRAMLVGITVR